jgi:hypothetical protein
VWVNKVGDWEGSAGRLRSCSSFDLELDGGLKSPIFFCLEGRSPKHLLAFEPADFLRSFRFA